MALQCSQRGAWSPANPTGKIMTLFIIMPLSTKAVIQVHKNSLHEAMNTTCNYIAS